jgi:hypothetical protein
MVVILLWSSSLQCYTSSGCPHHTKRGENCGVIHGVMMWLMMLCLSRARWLDEADVDEDPRSLRKRRIDLTEKRRVPADENVPLCICLFMYSFGQYIQYSLAMLWTTQSSRSKTTRNRNLARYLCIWHSYQRHKIEEVYLIATKSVNMILRFIEHHSAP